MSTTEKVSFLALGFVLLQLVVIVIIAELIARLLPGERSMIFFLLIIFLMLVGWLGVRRDKIYKFMPTFYILSISNRFISLSRSDENILHESREAVQLSVLIEKYQIHLKFEDQVEIVDCDDIDVLNTIEAFMQKPISQSASDK